MTHPAGPGYRIEDLARDSGTTVRTIRAYQDRGLLPKPERRGRANVYGAEHLARLRQIAELLDRGYTLASIKELLEAWDAGTGLGGVLGLVSEVDRPWSDERPARIGRAELIKAFGGVPDDKAIADAIELGVLEPVPGPGPGPERGQGQAGEPGGGGEGEGGGAPTDEFLVPSPQELAVAAELHAAGVPLSAISGHLRELRGQVEHIAERFLEFTTEYVFHRYLGHPPTEEEAEEAAGLVRRLRPLAQQTVDVELARAMRTLATQRVERHLGERATRVPPTAGRAPAPESARAASHNDGPLDAPADTPTHTPTHTPTDTPAHTPAHTPTHTPADASGGRPATARIPAPHAPAPPAPTPHTRRAEMLAVELPVATVRAVRSLVGSRNAAAFIAAAAEREVKARTMDALVRGGTTAEGVAVDAPPDNPAGDTADNPADGPA